MKRFHEGDAVFPPLCLLYHVESSLIIMRKEDRLPVLILLSIDVRNIVYIPREQTANYDVHSS